MNNSLRKTAVAAAVAGMLSAGGAAQADVATFSWNGAFTWLNPTGLPISNSPTDYSFNGFYGDGDGSLLYGAPYYPGNVGPGSDCTTFAPACTTVHGWYGNRTPVSGTLSFDLSTGAGVGTINPFFWLGDVAGAGPGTQIARYMNFAFQTVDTAGTMVGTMLLSWNGAGHSLSIVLDGSGLFTNLGAMVSGGPTTSVSGVGALPATNSLVFGSPVNGALPLGPTPIATTTRDALGCEAQLIAVQTNAYTINPTGNIANCDLTQDDGIGGSPAVSTAFANHGFNFDVTTMHLESFTPSPVPVPAAVWLFGSGLLGLIGPARRKKKTER